jgi:hypothetical protein
MLRGRPLAVLVGHSRVNDDGVGDKLDEFGDDLQPFPGGLGLAFEGGDSPGAYRSGSCHKLCEHACIRHVSKIRAKVV